MKTKKTKKDKREMKLNWLKNMMPTYWGIWFANILIISFISIIVFFCIWYLLLPKEVKLYKKGRRHLSKYERVEALEYFNEALEVDPDYVVVYRDRSQIYLEMARYDDAISDLTKAIELNPYSSKSYYYRGKIYNELERYEDAIEDYTRAISADPSNGSYYNTRGAMYKKIGNIEKAKEDYTKGCELGSYTACDRLKPYIIEERKKKGN